MFLAIVVVAGLTSSTPKSSNVGDCLKGNTDNADSVTSVACGPDADYKIVGKVPDQSQLALTIGGGCDQFPTATVAYWEGVKSSKGTLLCLEDVKNPDNRRPAVGECMAPGADQAASWSMRGSLATTTDCMQSVQK